MNPLYERASVIPGHSLTRSKAPGKMFDVGAGPMFAKSGDGAILTDVEGRRYIDMVCALGAISLGYGECLRQPSEAIQRGWTYSLPSAKEGQAAHAVIDTMAPWASQVRFVKTGSEATHAAYRIAKAATGRPHVLVGDWAYHGWHEWTALAPKYPPGFGFGHGGFFTLTHEHATVNIANEAVAAIVVEPHRWAETDAAWLYSLRVFCDRIGALLLFDDMIYGLRAHQHGSFGFFGVQPDLACFGKAMGNGAPIACVVGNDALREYGEMISGTYSGDEASLEAVIAVLERYRHSHGFGGDVVTTLWARGRQLRDRLTATIIRTDWAARAFVEGTILPHQRLRFTDPTLGRVFAAQMASRGILWHPDVINVSAAHTEAHIEHVVDAAALSLLAMNPA